MNLVYFDLESQKLFQEVGGRDASKLLLACGVTWSTARNDFAVYWEKDVQALIAELKSADRVIGFNTIKFDYEVLKPYAPHENLRAIRSTDTRSEQPKLPTESSRWNGSVTGNWRRLPSIAERM